MPAKRHRQVTSKTRETNTPCRKSLNWDNENLFLYDADVKLQYKRACRCQFLTLTGYFIAVGKPQRSRLCDWNV